MPRLKLPVPGVKWRVSCVPKTSDLKIACRSTYRFFQPPRLRLQLNKLAAIRITKYRRVRFFQTAPSLAITPRIFRERWGCPPACCTLTQDRTFHCKWRLCPFCYARSVVAAWRKWDKFLYLGYTYPGRLNTAIIGYTLKFAVNPTPEALVATLKQAIVNYDKHLRSAKAAVRNNKEQGSINVFRVCFDKQHNCVKVELRRFVVYVPGYTPKEPSTCLWFMAWPELTRLGFRLCLPSVMTYSTVGMFGEPGYAAVYDKELRKIPTVRNVGIFSGRSRRPVRYSLEPGEPMVVGVVDNS